MLTIDEITVDKVMSWPRIVAALRDGHKRPKPQIGDIHFMEAGDGILIRGAWISGLGACVKAATIYPGNAKRMPPLGTIQGSVLLFDPTTGSNVAVIDGAAVTRWKTAGDSALGSDILSRRDARQMLMIGAGVMAGALILAHVALRPSIERVAIWNRTRARAEELATSLNDLGRPVDAVSDLEAGLKSADIISAATMSEVPLVKGALLKSGAHVDLVGAYTPSMREADDDAMRRSRIFVDYHETTHGKVTHIGELLIPIDKGVISDRDVLGDLYDLGAATPGRRSAEEITLFKNGGGGHLDLMTAVAIVAAVNEMRSGA
jgi:ornithine cyclodeaminase/alanine dehydrogenase-like protein (mu-crystallin family)